MLPAFARAARIACVLVIAFAAFACAFAADPDSPQQPQTPLFAINAKPYVRPNLLLVKPAKPEHKRVMDAKFISMSALAMGLTIADIERTQHCLGNGTCRELNPLLPTSRAGMYAVNIPVNAGLMYLSYRLKASGHRAWWIAPLAIAGGHLVGVGFKF